MLKETREGSRFGGAEEAEDWVISVSGDSAVDRITQGRAGEEGRGFTGYQQEGMGNTVHWA